MNGLEKALTITDARVEGRRADTGVRRRRDRGGGWQGLAGTELRIPESDLQPLPEGSYYLHQLVGCRVDTTDGATVGTVARVDGGAGAAVLAVDGAQGEVLVPLAQEICVGIDVGRE